MSRTSKMPVFYTFLVLLISEHFFGTWGLIIGIPLTMFLLDMLDVIPTE
jgi:predicted PurR-regulated permease PerM